MTAPAGAAPPIEHSHEHIVETFSDFDVCGIPVTTTVDIVSNFQVRLASSGFPLFTNTGRGTITWTNPATGKSVTSFFAGPAKDLSVIDNGDGTITIRTQVAGAAERVRLSDGTILSMDVGRVVFATVVDYNGTPTDVDDDVFISQTIESLSGPHPNAESDFELFCEVVVPALT